MLEKFQKVVDLKDRLAEKDDFRLAEKETKKIKSVKKTVKKDYENSQRQAIDEVFSDGKDELGNSLHRIERVEKRNNVFWFWMIGAVVLFLVLFLLWSFWSDKNKKPIVTNQEVAVREQWSAVVLVNGEVYYGLVGDIDKNPLTITSVYYDYNQTNNKATTSEAKESGNLRLVKRGKEVYGPDGAMTIFQMQIKYIEALKDDSKVLSAILEHEKQ
jgi:hypothetical protein